MVETFWLKRSRKAIVHVRSFVLAGKPPLVLHMHYTIPIFYTYEIRNVVVPSSGDTADEFEEIA